MPSKEFSLKRYGDIYQKTEGHCAYCGRELLPFSWCIDHIIPTSKGGSDNLCNLVPSCITCNSSKGGHDDVEFEEFLKTGGDADLADLIRRLTPFSRSQSVEAVIADLREAKIHMRSMSIFFYYRGFKKDRAEEEKPINE